MGEILDNIISTYRYIIYDLSDKRTEDLPLVSNPLPILVIVFLYLEFCTSIGPHIMKNRKAYELKNVIKCYNIGQILISLFITYEGLHYLLSKDYNLICDPITETNDPRVQRTARSSWVFFFAKNMELLETILFVLRKKTRQVSTLHLYHHTMMTCTSWIAVKYFPVGPFILAGTLNSFIHVLMYTYYFLAGLGPQYQKYLWWKKHMTLIQLIQFGIIISHNTLALFHNCNYPKLLHIFIIANTSMLTYMFSKFYYHNYIKAKPKKIEVITKETNAKEILKTTSVRRKNIRAGE